MRPPPDFVKKTQQQGWVPSPFSFVQRQWFFTVSTNPVYPNNTRNTLAQFAPVLNGMADGQYHDLTTYQNINDTGHSFVYTAYGVDIPITGLDSATNFHGTGALSVVETNFAILAWGCDSNGDDYFLNWQSAGNNASSFLPNEIDIVSQSKTGPTETTFQELQKALIALNDPLITPALVESLTRIKHDNGLDGIAPVPAGWTVIQNSGSSLLG